MASRYFATVRRAISTPSALSAATILSSERIFVGSSASIIVLILDLTARGSHEFSGGNAADGAFVHVDFLGDVFEREGL